MKTILDEVNNQLDDYRSKKIEIVDGLMYSQYDTIKTIEYFSNDKYESGQKDDYGRDKPFYNINKFRVNVATRATDFDTKNIELVAENTSSYTKSWIMSREVDEWMKEHKFGKTMNRAGFIRAKYGGAVLKKIEKNGELDIEVLSWKNTFNDQVDIDGGMIGEIHYMSPVKLSKMKDTWDGLAEHWDDLMKLAKTDDTGNKDDYSDERVVVYEIEGEMPKHYIDETADDDEYSLQLHYVAGDSKGAIYILHSQEIKESRYKYIPWMNIDGRSLGIGVVEEGIEAQVWTNDAVQMERDMMSFASKIFYQTNDETLEDNAMVEMDNGHIIKLADDGYFKQVNTVPTSFPELSSMVEKWDKQYERTSSTFNAVTGETMPSGTPFRQTAILNQEASSLFSYRREEMGLFYEEVFEQWIIPHLSKKINREHILSSEFTQEQLKTIDTSFSRNRANQWAIEQVLDNKIVTQEKYENAQRMFQSVIAETKDQRFLKIPKDYFKDIAARISIITTGEQRNKAQMFESLANIINVISNSYDPNTQQFTILNNPTLAKLFSKVIEMADVGISPAELGLTNREESSGSTGGPVDEQNALQNLSEQIQNQEQGQETELTTV